MRFRLFPRSGWIVGLGLICASCLHAEETPRLLEGELAGARYQIAVPANPNGCVLIFCHGYRLESQPLTADLAPLKSAYRDLVYKGWVVAATSYRRNGVIVTDAMSDVVALRAEIAKKFGVPRRVLLQGESMGGAIVTLLLEREPQFFAGALAVGPALKMEQSGEELKFTHHPAHPLLFLCNRNETAPAQGYLDAVLPSAPLPVLRTVDRDGHINVNQHEVAAAIEALDAWVDSGKPPAGGDATQKPEPRASAMTQAEGKAAAPLLQINPLYGNLTFDFQAADFARLGIARGDHFVLSVGSQSFRIKLGQFYSDVARGEWVAFFDAEDRLLVALNRGNAAQVTGGKLGDAGTISR